MLTSPSTTFLFFIVSLLLSYSSTSLRHTAPYAIKRSVPLPYRLTDAMDPSYSPEPPQRTYPTNIPEEVDSATPPSSPSDRPVSPAYPLRYPPAPYPPHRPKSKPKQRGRDRDRDSDRDWVRITDLDPDRRGGDGDGPTISRSYAQYLSIEREQAHEAERAQDQQYRAQRARSTSPVASTSYHHQQQQQQHAQPAPRPKSHSRSHKSKSHRSMEASLASFLASTTTHLSHEAAQAEAARAESRELVRKMLAMDEERVRMGAELEAARVGLEMHRAQLRRAQEEIDRATRTVQQVDREKVQAEERAARDRDRLRKVMLEKAARDAWEEGRKIGYEWGLESGRRAVWEEREWELEKLERERMERQREREAREARERDARVEAVRAERERQRNREREREEVVSAVSSPGSDLTSISRRDVPPRVASTQPQRVQRPLSPPPRPHSSTSHHTSRPRAASASASTRHVRQTQSPPPLPIPHHPQHSRAHSHPVPTLAPPRPPEPDHIAVHANSNPAPAPAPPPAVLQRPRGQSDAPSYRRREETPIPMDGDIPTMGRDSRISLLPPHRLSQLHVPSSPQLSMAGSSVGDVRATGGSGRNNREGYNEARAEREKQRERDWQAQERRQAKASTVGQAYTYAPAPPPGSVGGTSGESSGSSGSDETAEVEVTGGMGRARTMSRASGVSTTFSQYDLINSPKGGSRDGFSDGDGRRSEERRQEKQPATYGWPFENSSVHEPMRAQSPSQRVHPVGGSIYSGSTLGGSAIDHPSGFATSRPRSPLTNVGPPNVGPRKPVKEVVLPMPLSGSLLRGGIGARSSSNPGPYVKPFYPDAPSSTSKKGLGRIAVNPLVERLKKGLFRRSSSSSTVIPINIEPPSKPSSEPSPEQVVNPGFLTEEAANRPPPLPNDESSDLESPQDDDSPPVDYFSGHHTSTIAYPVTNLPQGFTPLSPIPIWGAQNIEDDYKSPPSRHIYATTPGSGPDRAAYPDAYVPPRSSSASSSNRPLNFIPGKDMHSPGVHPPYRTWSPGTAGPKDMDYSEAYALSPRSPSVAASAPLNRPLSLFDSDDD